MPDGQADLVRLREALPCIGRHTPPCRPIDDRRSERGELEEPQIMSADPSAPRSRRAVLAGALSGLGAIVAARFVQPEAASAATNDQVLVDGSFAGAGTTAITSSTTGAAIQGGTADGVGLWGFSSDTAVADFSLPSHRTGIIGVGGDPSGMSTNTDETGVYGWSDDVEGSSGTTGVWGDSFNGTGVLATGYWGLYALGQVSVTGDADSTGTGVYGFSGDSSAPDPRPGVGVQGAAGTNATGVYGYSGSDLAQAPVPTAGVGVLAAAGTSQVALRVAGKAQFSRSGRTYVSTNAYSRKITMAGVTTSSYIIATLQTRRTGVYVHAVVPASGYFTIYLNKAVTATTYVGYLVIN